jgi:glycerol-3-phosphate dehydrogenase
MKADVVVIGAGIVGSTIAREVSRYDLSIIVVEKYSDVAFGSPTKANTGIIHAGYDDKPRTVKAEHCSKGNAFWHRIAPDVGAPFKEIGSFVVALKEEDTNVLKELKERGEKNGVPDLEIIEDRGKLFEMEPNLNTKAIAALYAPTAAITSPYELAIAMAENAMKNGVKILLDTEVTNVMVRYGELKSVQTSKGHIKTNYVVNAAGLQADEVSAMAGINRFAIHPIKGEYCVFDNELNDFVQHILFPVPAPISKGIVVTPTVDGNILIGPNAQDAKDKDDSATTSSGLDEVFSGALRLIPELAEKKNRIIANFCGLRPEADTNDFVLESYDDVKGFINAAGMKSPGLTAAPAVAQTVTDLLRKSGLKLREKDTFSALRKPIDRSVRRFDVEKANWLVAQDPKYGHVICRCEHVTEGEVVEAIRRGATTLDGIKFRTRAGMGRCQGGFCGPMIVRILARELKVSPTKVTKKGPGSNLLIGETKSLLEETLK